ncbi:MAG: ABC transporter permease [Alphaproteobacteria bacterium]|nr:ABC transporter permease [Alphaproteobacteria bacterium]
MIEGRPDATGPGQRPPSYRVIADPVVSDRLQLRLSGGWCLANGLPGAADLSQDLSAHPDIKSILIEGDELAAWDSGLLTFLINFERLSADREITTDPAGLPDGVQRLLRLASAVPERAGARRQSTSASFLERVGQETQALVEASGEVLGFLGEAALAFGRLFRGRARFRRSDFLEVVQEVGAQALPIVALISFLVGVILAFLGAVQLLQFGAQIYVADMVAIGMARDMAAMMVGIILAGRTGAAFAAHIGTMQVNEEIDALSTMGLSPIDFLVLPRMLALMLMTPLLCIYAVVMGIFGGGLIGVTMLDISASVYARQTIGALSVIGIVGGLIKGSVYGAVVAVCGCLRGMQCGRSSAAVGAATTSAVVNSIIFIIVSMAILTVIYNVLGI